MKVKLEKGSIIVVMSWRVNGFSVASRKIHASVLSRQWRIEPGTTIISDCWKRHVNLSKHGYIHKTVNHSVEFVNEESFHTNKIEGHWRQMKARLPTHGRKREHYSSCLVQMEIYPQWRRFVESVLKRH